MGLPNVGDQILIGGLFGTLQGKVALLDSKNSRVVTDLRHRDGVVAGQRLEVFQSQVRVGTLLVKEVMAWDSWSTPDAGTNLDSIRKGDIVVLEVPDEK